MLKFTFTLALLTLSNLVSAGSATLNASITTSSARTLPVIVKTEVVSKGVCLLHFDNGKRRKVKCNSDNYAESQVVENIALR